MDVGCWTLTALRCHLMDVGDVWVTVGLDVAVRLDVFLSAAGLGYCSLLDAGQSGWTNKIPRSCGCGWTGCGGRRWVMLPTRLFK